MRSGSSYSLIVGIYTFFSYGANVINSNNLVTEKNFNFSSAYNNNEPPVTSEGPIQVGLSLLVRKVASVDENKAEVTLSVYLRQYFKETRITVNESLFSSATQPVIMDPRFMSKFWFPDLFIPSLKTFRVHKLLYNMESLNLYKDKTIRRSTGCEMTVVCSMDFRLFPMDVQRCQVEFTSYTFSAAIMFFSWKNDPALAFEENWNQLSHFDVEMEVRPDTIVRTYGNANFSFAALDIVLTRRLQAHLLQTYLPSSLFVAVSWISFLVPPDAVPGRMVLLVTTLLTLVTMFASIRANSPRSTSLKSIEVWIITCIMFVFCALTEYAMILYTAFSTIKTTDNTNGKKAAFTTRENGFVFWFLPAINRSKKTGPSQNPSLSTVSLSNNKENENGILEEEKNNLALKEEIIPKKPNRRLDMAAVFIFPFAYFIFNIIYWVSYLSCQS